MTTAAQVKEALGWLEKKSSKRVREEMSTRYGIVTPKAFGVPVGVIKKLGKDLGPSHELAQALWATSWYEARLLATFVDEPAKVTSAQMDRWVRDFDNWGICDTACFSLFDRTPHAVKKIGPWSKRREEFVRRAGFALLACVALHDAEIGDEFFLESLDLIEAASKDDRNFVKKGVSWALRSVGRRSGPVHAAAMELGRTLAESDDPTARWLGRDTIRDIGRPVVIEKLTGGGRKKAR